MPKVEVEHRGILTRAKFDELSSFLRRKGRYLGRKNRFSVIYSPSSKRQTFKLNRGIVDLKLRITNKKTELVLKHG